MGLPVASPLQEGTVFAGRYRVLRCIAAGGMGAVYEVLHLETERRRALKVMLPHILQSDDLRERFKREAKVAAHIETDLIVDVFDAGLDDTTGMPFLVMELLKGEDLRQRLRRAGPLSPDELVLYLRQAALALDKTHQASIIHRDLKPENLFITVRDDGPPLVKVLDFGVAKVVAESATAGGTQTLGTPLYMAPEQFDPHARLTGAVDVFALGMVAYTSLVGAAYWSEESRSGNVFALATVAMRGPGEAASARAARRGVALTPAFDAWFAKATAAHPAYRFATAGEAVRALADALAVLGRASWMEPSVASTAAPASVRLPAQPTGSPLTATSRTGAPGTRAAFLASFALLVVAVAVAGVTIGVRLLAPDTHPVTASVPPAVTLEPVSTATASASAAAPEAPPEVTAPEASASARPPAVLPPRRKKIYTQE